MRLWRLITKLILGFFISTILMVLVYRVVPVYLTPLMAIRAGKDALVNTKDAEEIIAYTSAEHYLLDLDQGDHLFSDRAITETMIIEICNWLNSKLIAD